MNKRKVAQIVQIVIVALLSVYFVYTIVIFFQNRRFFFINEYPMENSILLILTGLFIWLLFSIVVVCIQKIDSISLYMYAIGNFEICISGLITGAAIPDSILINNPLFKIIKKVTAIMNILYKENIARTVEDIKNNIIIVIIGSIIILAIFSFLMWFVEKLFEWIFAGVNFLFNNMKSVFSISTLLFLWLMNYLHNKLFAHLGILFLIVFVIFSIILSAILSGCVAHYSINIEKRTSYHFEIPYSIVVFILFIIITVITLKSGKMQSWTEIFSSLIPSDYENYIGTLEEKSSLFALIITVLSTEIIERVTGLIHDKLCFESFPWGKISGIITSLLNIVTVLWICPFVYDSMLVYFVDGDVELGTNISSILNIFGTEYLFISNILSIPLVIALFAVGIIVVVLIISNLPHFGLVLTCCIVLHNIMDYLHINNVEPVILSFAIFFIMNIISGILEKKVD